MKVWITKYALTQGIFQVDADRRDDSTITVAAGQGTDRYVWLPDWHLDYLSAWIQAKAMQHQEVLRLQRRLAKIAALEFPEEWKP